MVIPVILADTAGIRDAKNEVEKKGISLALGKSKEADLNIVVIDNSSKSINNEIKKMINKDTIVLLINQTYKINRIINLMQIRC
jgi:tRNA modification GTPase